MFFLQYCEMHDISLIFHFYASCIVSKTRFMVIEDSLQIKHFKRSFAGKNAFFCSTYTAAQKKINDLKLESDECLYVILDHDLGINPDRKDGVDLFFLIRKKFPAAYIVNFSGDSKNFLDKVQARYLTEMGCFERIFMYRFHEIVKFDYTPSADKSAVDIIASALKFEEDTRRTLPTINPSDLTPRYQAGPKEVRTKQYSKINGCFSSSFFSKSKGQKMNPTHRIVPVRSLIG